MAARAIRRGRLLASTLLLALPMVPAAPDPPGDPARDVVVTLHSIQERHCRGERIAVDCEIANRSTRLDYDYFRSNAPDFSPTGPEMRFHVLVTRDGEKVPLTLFGRLTAGGSTGSSKGLVASSRETRRLAVSAIYDMTLVGEYRIIAALPVDGVARGKGRGTTGFVAWSEPVIVKVVADCP